MEKVKRYVVFLFGLFISSLGVSLITKADLGTSPISSIPYVLSLSFPFTLGQFTVAFSLLLILVQVLILRRNFKAEHLLQIPISVLFGYFIDMTMVMLSFVRPQSYFSSVLYLLAGCVILGVGVYGEVLANVAMLPGESFVRAVVTTWKTDFGSTKVAFDVSITAIAGALSFLLTRRLEGIREGTVIAAFLVGFIARFIGRKLSFLEGVLFPEDGNPGDRSQAGSGAFPVVVIDRQFGSGGHDIGQTLAGKLGYSFYDNEIIQMTAGSTGYTPEFIQKREETMSNRLLYDWKNQMYIYSDTKEAPQDEIFESEKKVILELAKKGPCVIIGRCADYVLRNRPHTLRVFLHAPEQARKERVMRLEHLSEEEALQKMRKVDRRRADHYTYYTRRIWGHVPNYDLALDTTVGEEAVIAVITELLGIKCAEKI